jgi:hypothetical protein
MANSGSKSVSYEQFMAHQKRENLWVLLHGKGPFQPCYPPFEEMVGEVVDSHGSTYI